MANAATIAGLAFSNAFVGVNHALAHAVGARFGIAHGRANAIFLPHVLRYNAVAADASSCPRPATPPTSRPRSTPRSRWIIGLGGKTEEQRRERLFATRRGAAGRRRHAALARSRPASRAPSSRQALPELARAAFEDPSIRTNPRIPLVRELTELLEPASAGGSAAGERGGARARQVAGRLRRDA